MKPEVKKLIIANLPYLLFVYLFGKLGQAYRLAEGIDLSQKLLHFADGCAAAFANAAPSFNSFDLLIGVAGAAALRLMVYCKGKNAKKYRKGVEYGSARWGGPKDILSCVFNVFNVTMNNIVSSEGAAKTTMCALLLGAVLNIGLDPLFIYTFNMGVAGAAIATAISQMVSTLVYLTYVLRKRSAFSFSVKAFSPTGQMMAEILKIGIPTLVFQLLTSLSITLINRAASDYGDSVIAGMGAVTRITSMGTLVVFGFLKGFQPIAGFSYGAKKFDRLREAIKTSIIWSTSFCLVVGLAMAIFSTQIISQFSDGDMAQVLRYYEGYIFKLCTRTLYDEDGYPHVCVDEYMKHRLEIKLIHSIDKQEI